MYWEKKICIRLTTRRIMGAVLMASAVVNIVIVGAVFEAAASTSPLTLTPLIVTTTQLNTVPATTAVFVATETATSAAISTSTSTVRLTATDIATDLPTLTMCIVQSSWPSYYVQQGDTLLTLARLTGSSMDELMLANCLPDQNIRPGQLLYVLRLPFKPFTFTPSAAPTDTPTATPTNTSSVTPTPTPSATQTDTPTATLTNTPNTPTVFQDPYGELSLCSIYPSEIFFHVTPSDSQGVRSVSVSYQIDDGPWIDLPMGPDGDTYYGGQSLNGDYSAGKKVTYFFSAFDNSEDQTNTIVYDASITYCPYQGG